MAEDTQVEAARFDATVEAGRLLAFFNTVYAIRDEVVLEVGETGFAVECVDPANVAIVDARLDIGAFDIYDAASARIGIHLPELVAFLETVGVDEEVHLAGVGEKHLQLTADGFRFEPGVLDPDSVRRGGDIVELSFSARARIPTDRLQRIVERCDLVSSYIVFAITEQELLSISAEGDVTLGAFVAQRGVDSIDVEYDEPVRSVFSLDYIKDVVGAMPGGVHVDVLFDDEWPTRFEFDLHGGTAPIQYTIAPRIQK